MNLEALAPEGHHEVIGDATTPPTHRQFCLKEGDLFLVCDRLGDVHGAADGLFLDDTRLLSRLLLRLAGDTPALLSTAVGRDNVIFTAHMTNRPLSPLGQAGTPEGVVHIERKRLLFEGRLYERLLFTNYGDADAHLPLEFSFDADFRDMFEVRGQPRANHGRIFGPEPAGDRVEFRYLGLDGVERRCELTFSEAPGRLGPHSAALEMDIPPGEHRAVYLEIGPERGPTPSPLRFRRAALQAKACTRARLQRGARVRSSGRLFDDWIERSRSDLALLTTELPTGPYPYAGIPWFSTTFGRDAIFTAWQVLWLNPGLARGVLRFLASTQATEVDSFRDSAPGKILHEARRGEMAARGEVPFGKYYGGVDTTCLYVVLAAAYAGRTGDLALIDELWPSLLAAVGWMDSFNGKDKDPLGLIRYARAADTGLVNQGWKDSGDSIFHADGRFPDGPIALVEVQGYAFAAYRGMARLAAARGHREQADVWRARADRLRHVVEQHFWMEEQGFYGIALDGHDQLCRVKASNAGHLLFVGLPTAERARSVIRELTGPTFANGWGIRTLACDQPRYNPMSYHNGSVWPHDTAICAAGFRRYGAGRAVREMISELFETAVRFDMRLPELFCGFTRAGGEPPVAYPVACLPQAWAATAVFGLLQASLGLTVNGWRGELHLRAPRLPVGISELRLDRMPIGDRPVDVLFREAGDRVMVLPGRDEQHGVPLITHT
jgi:glycogen debranching enzyme